MWSEAQIVQIILLRTVADLEYLARSCDSGFLTVALEQIILMA